LVISSVQGLADDGDFQQEHVGAVKLGEEVKLEEEE
jgi:hypothetical protein